MQFTGKIVWVYPEQTGTYLGESYRYMDVIAVAEETLPNSTVHDKLCLRLKNDMLQEFKRRGCQSSGTYTFTLQWQCDERHRKTDNVPYAINRTPVCIAIEQAVI